MATNNLNKIKVKFEVWATAQFGYNINIKLKQFDIEDGYQDPTINAMWIGFNAGLLQAE